jgi:D-apiose dehydrogenase
MKVWRGGMIGAGAWSEIQLTAWMGVMNANIVALCDRHPERLNPVVQRFGIPHAYDDYETMMDEVELDFVDICTRPYSHPLLVRLAAKRGLPILCQKPFCNNLDEAREADEFCRKAGVRLMINENFRWQAWYRKAKELMDLGELGVPFLAMVHKRARISLPEFDHPQTYLAEMPQLIVLEVGVHYIDTFRFLFGEPDTIFARLHHISPHMKGEDVQLITLSYQGFTGVINLSWASIPVPGLDRPKDERGTDAPPRMEIEGTKGTLILKCDGSLDLFTDNEQKKWNFYKDTIPKSRITTQQHFINSLERDVEFETSGTETLKTMSLVYSCYLSAREGRVVDPKQIICLSSACK